MKGENEQKHDDADNVENICSCRKKLTICKQNKNSQDYTQKEVKQLPAVIGIKCQETTQQVLIPVCGCKYAGDACYYQYNIDDDDAPINSLRNFK